MRQASPRCWLKLARWPSHTRRFLLRLRAYPSHLKSWKFTLTSVPHSWYTLGQGACQKIKTNMNEGLSSLMLYWFSIPNNIITDIGTQFTAREFKDFCVDSDIKIKYASVSHSQSNRQVERSNVMILQGSKPRIFNTQKPYVKKWVK
jgi:hypothetical protein